MIPMVKRGDSHKPSAFLYDTTSVRVSVAQKGSEEVKQVPRLLYFFAAENGRLPKVTEYFILLFVFVPHFSRTNSPSPRGSRKKKKEDALWAFL